MESPVRSGQGYIQTSHFQIAPGDDVQVSRVRIRRITTDGSHPTSQPNASIALLPSPSYKKGSGKVSGQLGASRMTEYSEPSE